MAHDDTRAATLVNGRAIPEEMRSALDRLREQPLPLGSKVIPGGAVGSPGEVASNRWRLFTDGLPFPQLVVKWPALQHNVQLLQRYCDANQALLAPHGKTTMSPQVFAEQWAAGAWAICVATVSQLRVCRMFGIPRVVLANQVISGHDLTYIATEIRDDPGWELVVLADSVVGVERLAAALQQAGCSRPVDVLVEYGPAGSRCGVRSFAAAQTVIDAVVAHEPAVRLAGVEGYEPTIPREDTSSRFAPLDSIDGYLRDLAQVAKLAEAATDDSREFIVSAGGSTYFDRAVQVLNAHTSPRMRVLIRPGVYVAHYFGEYDQWSPFGHQKPRLDFGTFTPALEAWAHVISQPEPGFAILGIGKRDLPTEVYPPLPTGRVVDGRREPLDTGFSVAALHDHHTCVRYPDHRPLDVGDLVGLGIQHLSGAFDKWRQLLVVDDDYTVQDVLVTYF